MSHQLRALQLSSAGEISSAPRHIASSLLWIQTFDTVEDLRQALLKFREAYNATWLIERHGFRPPNAVRQEQLSTTAAAA